MPPVARRVSLGGVALGIGAAPLLSPPGLLAQGAGESYPPALTGLRGAHPGSFETAHALALTGQRWPSPAESGDEIYDLVVVGGGISGLAAACFYRTEQPRARVLVLDNHDDFGGRAEAKRLTPPCPALTRYRRP